MFDLLPTVATIVAPAATPASSATPWLALMLDEIDYGMLLLSGGTAVLHANHAARSELDGAHPLQLVGGELRVARPQDLLPLRDALEAVRVISNAPTSPTTLAVIGLATR